jgi:Protein of unknown function (DUF3347)
MKKTVFLLAATAMVAAVAAAQDLPATLVDPYLQVQVALSADQFEGVAKHGEAIEKAASALGADAAAIVAGAKKLAAAKDIAAARTAFGEVSSALTDYAEKTKSGFGPDVRVAYCPMVNKPWLTKDKTIRNPYYGSSMLTCGSFKK